MRGFGVLIAIMALCAGAQAQASPRPQPAPGLHGQGITPDMRDPAEGVGITQHLGASLPLDARFVDHRGQDVRIGDFFGRGRPVILALVYFDCPMLCSQLLQSLVANLKVVDYDAGTDFDVLVISIDHEEDAELAGRAHRTYTKRYGREGTEEGWNFLVGERVEIDRVCQAVGYTYEYVPQTGEYAHAAGIQVCTDAGVLSRYFYGTAFPARDLQLGIVDASEGTIGSLADEIRLLCLSYDPTTGKYGLVIMRTLRLLGLLTLTLVVGFVAVHLWRERRRGARASLPAGAASEGSNP